MSKEKDLHGAAVDPSLIGPTLPSIPPFTLPTGPTGQTGPTGPSPTMRLQFLYIANSGVGDNTVEIYDIFNPIFPVRVGEFNGGNLDMPAGLIIIGTTLYVSNAGDNTVEIYNISNPTVPVRVGEFNGGNLDGPAGLKYIRNEYICEFSYI